MSRQNTTYCLAERPKGEIVRGVTFKPKTEPAPQASDLQDGQLLVETLYMSLDPAMRGWINDMRSYVPPVQIGEKMRSNAIVRVLASKSPIAQPGDFGVAMTGWTEVTIVDAKSSSSSSSFEPIDVPKGAKLTDALGPLGMTGMTAYFGLDRIGKPQRGETVVVSGAAGATGSMVGQFAKLAGARVVGFAGSDEKCEWLRSELGFDVALNYKSPTFRDDFVKATPNYVNVYWDNVGGEILDMVLTRAALKARFVMCGSISGYNSPGKQSAGIKNLMIVVAQRIRMEGFIVFDYAQDYAKAKEQIKGWLAEGKIRNRETIVKGGIDHVEDAWFKLFGGENTGKLLLEVKEVKEAKL